MRPEHTNIAVAVCTYNRNAELETLLRALVRCAEHVTGRAAVGVIIVDDTRDGRARDVAARFATSFELGLRYRISGRQNISIARNMALESAIELAQWTAMTDDDCEPIPEWLTVLLEVQHSTGALTVTGPMRRRVPANSPRWLTEQPFLDLGNDDMVDGAEMTTAFTNNSLISSEWLRQHPEVRFEPSLGVIGGEDMVFFRTARAKGLRIHFAKNAIMFENEPPSRTTLSYQLRRFFWHGNSSYVSSVATGVHPARMLLHGIASLLRALGRPLKRLVKGTSPQFRYSLASVLEAIGKIIGYFGVRVRHH